MDRRIKKNLYWNQRATVADENFETEYIYMKKGEIGRDACGSHGYSTFPEKPFFRKHY